MPTKKANRLREGDYICRQGLFPVRVLALETEKDMQGHKIVVYTGNGVLRFWFDEKIEVSDDSATS